MSKCFIKSVSIFALCLSPVSNKGPEENQTRAMSSAARETPQMFVFQNKIDLFFFFKYPHLRNVKTHEVALMHIVYLILGPIRTVKGQKLCQPLLPVIRNFRVIEYATLILPYIQRRCKGGKVRTILTAHESQGGRKRIMT